MIHTSSNYCFRREQKQNASSSLCFKKGKKNKKKLTKDLSQLLFQERATKESPVPQIACTRFKKQDTGFKKTKQMSPVMIVQRQM